MSGSSGNPGLADVLTDDAVLGGALRLLQPRSGHRFGHDAVLLAAATAARPGEHAVDLGAGVGTAGLALAKRIAGISVTLVEIDAALCRLAAENIARNGMANRVAVARLDVAESEAFEHANLKAGCADRVLMNPPFHAAARTQSSPDAARRLAHVAQEGSVAIWISAAARLLRPGGMLTMIYRADGLTEVLAALGSSFEQAEVLPVYPKPDAAPIRLIVQARRQGEVSNKEAEVRTGRGLYLNGAGGKPTPEAEAILRHGAALRFI